MGNVRLFEKVKSASKTTCPDGVKSGLTCADEETWRAKGAFKASSRKPCEVIFQRN